MQSANESKQATIKNLKGVQTHFNEPPGQLGGIKFKSGRSKNRQPPDAKQPSGIKHLDHKLKKQIEQKTAEMQKIVRE